MISGSLNSLKQRVEVTPVWVIQGVPTQGLYFSVYLLSVSILDLAVLIVFPVRNRSRLFYGKSN